MADSGGLEKAAVWAPCCDEDTSVRDGLALAARFSLLSALPVGSDSCAAALLCATGGISSRPFGLVVASTVVCVAWLSGTATVGVLSAATWAGSIWEEEEVREVADSETGTWERPEAGVGCRMAEGGAGVLEGCLSGPCEEGPAALRRIGALGLKPTPPFFLSIVQYRRPGLGGLFPRLGSRTRCGRQLFRFRSCGGIKPAGLPRPLPAKRVLQF